MPSDQNRAFNYAVLASIALHALFLFGFFGLKDPAKRPAPLAPIVAKLAQPPDAPPAPAVAPQTEPLKPPPWERAASPSKTAPIAKPLAKAESAATPKAAPSAPPAPAVEPPAPAPSQSASSAAPVAPAAPPPIVAKIDPAAAPASPSAEAVDTGSLAQYRLQLISMARKYKRYPRVAMDNNWEGNVVVRMVIGADGTISALSIKTSSGHEMLDQEALEMFQKAKPLVQIPSALRGKEFTIELRAIYNLREQDSG